MCGIGGCILPEGQVLGKAGAALCVSMLATLEARGHDAFGYLYERGGKALINKQPMSVSDFLRKPKHIRGVYNDILGSRVALFHTRAATGGSEKKNKNNHPFTFGRFVLAHNGGIRNHKDILERLDTTTHIETDSIAILAFISSSVQKGGLSVAESLGVFVDGNNQGSAACWLYDRITKKVWLFKDSGVLSMAKLGGGVVFASIDNFIKNNYSFLDKESIDDLSFKDVIAIDKDGTFLDRSIDKEKRPETWNKWKEILSPATSQTRLQSQAVQNAWEDYEYTPDATVCKTEKPGDGKLTSKERQDIMDLFNITVTQRADRCVFVWYGDSPAKDIVETAIEDYIKIHDDIDAACFHAFTRSKDGKKITAFKLKNLHLLNIFVDYLNGAYMEDLLTLETYAGMGK